MRKEINTGYSSWMVLVNNLMIMELYKLICKSCLKNRRDVPWRVSTAQWSQFL